MQGHLTYNRIINLLTVYFFHNDWMDQTPDYVKEKYDRIFCCLPDRITIVNDKIIYPKTIPNEVVIKFYNNIREYRKKWNYKKGVLLSKDEIILLFTVSYISNGYLNPHHLQKRYSNLFTSFDFINDFSVEIGLHELLRQSIERLVEEREQEFLPYKRISKLLKIKRHIK